MNDISIKIKLNNSLDTIKSQVEKALSENYFSQAFKRPAIRSAQKSECTLPDWSTTKLKWTPNALKEHYFKNHEYKDLMVKANVFLNSGKISTQDKATIKSLLKQQYNGFLDGKKAFYKGNYSVSKSFLVAEFCATKSLRDVFTSLEQRLQARSLINAFKYI